MALTKASVTLGGVRLSGAAPITWRLQSGVVPYTTTVQVNWRSADAIEALAGSPTTLRIRDGRDNVTSIQQVYVLHRAPTDSNARVAFVIADRRWTWNRNLIVRDFNIPKRTGNRTAFQAALPQNDVTVDLYDFAPYSIKADGTRYSAREALELVLSELVGDFDVVSFPFGGGTGQISLQDVQLRDAGDAALNRLLQYLPGVGIFVRADGRVVVYDQTDTRSIRSYIERLPRTQWSGEVETWIDRSRIRPSQVRVHYTREVELPVDYSDDYAGNTSSRPGQNVPFLENVLPTVDPVTEITEYDPETDREVRKRVPAGTWVEVSQWLAAMDADRPEGSSPWTFQAIRMLWVAGDLEGALGAGGLDLDEDGNVAARVQALRQHFRQTFRISRRYVERIRSLRAVRVVVLDPVTGARADAPVWNQACIVPSQKGMRVTKRGPSASGAVFRNVDYLAASEGGEELIETSPSPARIQIIDEDIGIFHVSWELSPYGTESTAYPCHLVDSSGGQKVVSRDLAEQDRAPVVTNAQAEFGTNGLFLANTMRLKAVLTIVPAAPNDARQFHRIDVEPSEVAALYGSTLQVTGGSGPPFELYITPNEETARFAIEDTDTASTSVRQLLGLEGDAIEPTSGIPGYVLANDGVQGERHLAAHAKAAAAEVLVPFGDSYQGAFVTRMPGGGIPDIEGNLGAVAVRVAQYPSAKVDVVHQLPGQAPPTSRFALLPQSTRTQILGVLPFT